MPERGGSDCRHDGDCGVVRIFEEEIERESLRISFFLIFLFIYLFLFDFKINFFLEILVVKSKVVRALAMKSFSLQRLTMDLATQNKNKRKTNMARN